MANKRVNATFWLPFRFGWLRHFTQNYNPAKMRVTPDVKNYLEKMVFMEKDSFSFRNGANFYFKENGHTINLWFSALTGLEKVYIDGILVSKQRNFSVKSEQSFKLGESTYKSEYNTKNIFKGPYVCTLYKDNNPYKSKKLIFFDETHGSKPFYVKFWFYLLIGLVFGIIHGAFNMPGWSLIVFILVLFASTYKLHSKYKSEPRVVEENV